MTSSGDRTPDPIPSSDAEMLALLERSDPTDAGIKLFEQRIKVAEIDIAHRYVGKAGNEWGYADDTLSSLESLWPFDGDTAVVSGRIFVVDDEYTDMAPEEWGEVQRQEGIEEPFFFVDDVELISKGIESQVTWDYDDETVKSFAITYAFAFPGDDEERVLLMALPNELEKHEYKEPSLEEVRRRLEVMWPSQFEVLRKLVRADGVTSLPERLVLIQSKLQRELRNSKKFRGLVAPFLSTEFEFHREVPYAVSLSGGLQYFDGENPHDDDDPGSWCVIPGSEVSELDLYDPCVHVYVRKDGAVELHIYGMVFSIESDDPEFVAIDPQAVTSFNSRIAKESMSTIALRLSSSSDQSSQAE